MVTNENSDVSNTLNKYYGVIALYHYNLNKNFVLINNENKTIFRCATCFIHFTYIMLVNFIMIIFTCHRLMYVIWRINAPKYELQLNYKSIIPYYH
jgi:hypothetical protein